MGKDLYDRFPRVRERFAIASEILEFDLAKVCFEGPIEDLTQTRVTQPALYVHSCILTELLSDHGFRASSAAGHSLGEYSALQAADAFSFEDGLKLVKVRANAMQHAGEVNPGTMAAVIGLDDDGVNKMCEAVSAEGVAVPANFNSPGQVVVSGDKAAIAKIVAEAKSFGARMAKPLPVSGAFHSPLMQPAADQLAEALKLAEIRSPKFTVISNVTAKPHGEPESIRDLLAKQLLSPVRWTDCLGALQDTNANWYEVGSGSVLSGLLKRTIKDASAAPISDADSLDKVAGAQEASK